MTPKLISKLSTIVTLGSSALALGLRQLFSISTTIQQSVPLTLSPKQNLKLGMPTSQTHQMSFRLVTPMPISLALGMGQVLIEMPLDSLVFYKLSDHDGLTLAEMDGKLLRELDYYILPNPFLDNDGNFLVDEDGNILEG